MNYSYLGSSDLVDSGIKPVSPKVLTITRRPEFWHDHLVLLQDQAIAITFSEDIENLPGDVTGLDLLLLDTDHGPDHIQRICHQVRSLIESGQLSVILLDDGEGEADPVVGLAAGASDYFRITATPLEWAVRAKGQLRLLRANRRMQHHNQELEMLDAIIETVNRETGFQETVECLLQQGLTLLPAAKNAVFLMWARDHYEFGAAYGYALETLQQIRFTEQELMERLSIHTRQLERGIYLSCNPEPSQPIQTSIPIPKATLTMEVELAGHRGGYLVWDNPEDPTAFDQSDIRRLSRFRGHALSAMARAWYVRELEGKNQEITNGIDYARKIQEALQPEDRLLETAFVRHFVISNPKHTVSTDFYWLAETEKARYLAVADCAGEGVAGILMSLVGQRMLANLLARDQNGSPATILELLHGEIRHILGRTPEETKTIERIDVCLCRFEKRRNRVAFAGARRPLYWIRPGNNTNRSTSLVGDRHPVSVQEKVCYTDQFLEPEPGDMIYLTTDGFAAQLDKNGNKLGVRRLNTLLQEIAELETAEQRNLLLKTWNDFRGETGQTDDLTIIGIGF